MAIRRYPLGGESVEELLRQIVANLSRPAEDIATALTLSARLGTTSSATIDCRGYTGVIVATRITAVAGAGTLQTRIASSADPNFFTTWVTGTAATTSHHVAAFSGAAAGSSGLLGVVSLPLGRYLRIDGINSSAVPGNEVTFETKYLLIR